MKYPDDHRVHRTRSIPLLEADGNDSFKQLASQATELAEEYGLHASEQYGGKAFHAPIHCVSVKNCLYDVSRQQK